MSDDADLWRAVRDTKATESETRRRQAREDFPAAYRLAAAHGLTLLIHTHAHYQLIHPDGWVLNIYPGNQRLNHDANRKGPFVRVKGEWTLISVVEAVIEAERAKVKP